MLLQWLMASRRSELLHNRKMFYTFRLLTQTHLDCGDIKRLGNTGDGGWDICVVDPYFPKPGCIVYSFGWGCLIVFILFVSLWNVFFFKDIDQLLAIISTIKLWICLSSINYDFTFDDSVAETFGCEVRTFDPRLVFCLKGMWMPDICASIINKFETNIIYKRAE